MEARAGRDPRPSPARGASSSIPTPHPVKSLSRWANTDQRHRGRLHRRRRRPSALKPNNTGRPRGAVADLYKRHASWRRPSWSRQWRSTADAGRYLALASSTLKSRLPTSTRGAGAAAWLARPESLAGLLPARRRSSRERAVGRGLTLKRAVDSTPTRRAWSALGFVYEAQNKLKQLGALFKEALKANPDNATSPWSGSATCCVKLGTTARPERDRGAASIPLRDPQAGVAEAQHGRQLTTKQYDKAVARRARLDPATCGRATTCTTLMSQLGQGRRARSTSWRRSSSNPRSVDAPCTRLPLRHAKRYDEAVAPGGGEPQDPRTNRALPSTWAPRAPARHQYDRSANVCARGSRWTTRTKISTSSWGGVEKRHFRRRHQVVPPRAGSQARDHTTTWLRVRGEGHEPLRGHPAHPAGARARAREQLLINSLGWALTTSRGAPEALRELAVSLAKEDPCSTTPGDTSQEQPRERGHRGVGKVAKQMPHKFQVRTKIRTRGRTSSSKGAPPKSRAEVAHSTGRRAAAGRPACPAAPPRSAPHHRPNGPWPASTASPLPDRYSGPGRHVAVRRGGRARRALRGHAVG